LLIGTHAGPKRDPPAAATRTGVMSQSGVQRVMTNMERDYELALVVRLKAADSAAFDEVHAAFNTRLFNFLARLSRRRDVAEDLLEETWFRFVDVLPRLRDDTRLAPLLFKISRNLHVSYCRSRAIEDQHAPGMIGLWPSGCSAPSPFDATVARETGERLDEALATLPAIYREALLLVAVDDMKPAEAAAVCGITPEAMRQRLSRGRALLARQLDEGDAAGALDVRPAGGWAKKPVTT
jgi:RNA polymerase sigma factor (sigma-70 family)